MSDTLEQAWMAHLETVRWFGGKGADGTITRLEPLPWWTATDAIPAVRSEVATVSYPAGISDTYHLLVAYYPAGAEMPETEAPRTVLCTTADTGLSGDWQAVDATTDPGALQAFVAATAPAFASNPVGVWSGEQSNTTLIIGNTELFKLFRKIEPGPNLEAELLSALTDAAVPRVRHRLTAPWPAGATTDLGILLERIPQAQDGWVLASQACREDLDFADEAQALGEALADIHHRLSTVFGSVRTAGSQLHKQMNDRLAAAVRSAPELAPYASPLQGVFAAVAGHELAVQRIHGDFHLGQCLRNHTGWTIIDFEGEPAKSAADRRAPDSPWRDVAGMLRSFDYARSAHADPSGSVAIAWAKRSRDAFLRGYCGPTKPVAKLLRAYEMDKAIYEVLYELRNRPDWLEIPMTALREATT